MDMGYVREVLVPSAVIFRIMPVLAFELILDFLHACFAAIVLSGYVRMSRIVVKDKLLAFVATCAVILMVVFVQQVYIDEIVQIAGVHFNLSAVQVAERGFRTVVLVVFIPFTVILIVILIPVEVEVRSVELVGILRMGIIVCLVPAVMVPFEGVLVGERVLFSQFAVNLKFPAGKRASVGSHKRVRLMA